MNVGEVWEILMAECRILTFLLVIIIIECIL